MLIQVPRSSAYPHTRLITFLPGGKQLKTTVTTAYHRSTDIPLPEGVTADEVDVYSVFVGSNNRPAPGCGPCLLHSGRVGPLALAAKAKVAEVATSVKEAVAPIVEAVAPVVKAAAVAAGVVAAAVAAPGVEAALVAAVPAMEAAVPAMEAAVPAMEAAAVVVEAAPVEAASAPFEPADSAMIEPAMDEEEKAAKS